MEELEEGLKVLREFSAPWREQQCQQARHPELSGLDHRPKNTHGVTHGSGYICGRGRPCRSSVGGEALGPEDVWCPIVGEYQDGETKWMGTERPHRSKVKGLG